MFHLAWTDGAEKPSARKPKNGRNNLNPWSFLQPPHPKTKKPSCHCRLKQEGYWIGWGSLPVSELISVARHTSWRRVAGRRASAWHMFSEDVSVLVHRDSIVAALRYNVAQMTVSGVMHIKKKNKPSNNSFIPILFNLISIVYIHQQQDLPRLHLLSI